MIKQIILVINDPLPSDPCPCLSKFYKPDKIDCTVHPLAQKICKQINDIEKHSSSNIIISANYKIRSNQQSKNINTSIDGSFIQTKYGFKTPSLQRTKLL